MFSDEFKNLLVYLHFFKLLYYSILGLFIYLQLHPLLQPKVIRRHRNVNLFHKKGCHTMKYQCFDLRKLSFL